MRGAYGPSPSSGIYSPSVYSWNLATDSFGSAVLGTSPFLSGTPTPNNLAYVFAKELARHHEEEIYLTLIASDGKKIEYFLPNSVLSANGWVNSQTDPFFGSSGAEELMGATGDAALALAALGKSRYDVVLQHQGEANISITDGNIADTAAAYEAKVAALYEQLDSRGLIDLGSTPILIGHINPDYPVAGNHASAISTYAGATPKVSTVGWSGVDTVGGTNKHATGLGLEQLGIRYFNAYAAM